MAQLFSGNIFVNLCGHSFKVTIDRKLLRFITSRQQQQVQTVNGSWNTAAAYTL